ETQRAMLLAVLLLSWCTAGWTQSPEVGAQLVVTVDGVIGAAPTFGAGMVFARDETRIYIATANHVVRAGGQAASRLKVRLKAYPKKPLSARLLPQADVQRDVAVLLVEGPAAQGVDMCVVRLDRLAKPGMAKRGDPVYPIGSPNGVPWASPVVPDV